MISSTPWRLDKISLQKHLGRVSSIRTHLFYQFSFTFLISIYLYLFLFYYFYFLFYRLYRFSISSSENVGLLYVGKINPFSLHIQMYYFRVLQIILCIVIFISLIFLDVSFICSFPPHSHLPTNHSNHLLTYPSTHLACIDILLNLSVLLTIHSLIYLPLPLLNHLLSTIQLPVLYPPSFIFHTHILSCPSTFLSIISMPKFLPSTYQFTHLPFFQNFHQYTHSFND